MFRSEEMWSKSWYLGQSYYAVKIDIQVGGDPQLEKSTENPNLRIYESMWIPD